LPDGLNDRTGGEGVECAAIPENGKRPIDRGDFIK